MLVVFSLLYFSKFNERGSYFISKTYLCFISLLILISLQYSIFHSTYDFEVPYAYFIMFVEVFIGSYLVYIIYLKKYSFTELLKFISLAQSIIILLMFGLEPFREFIFSITNTDAEKIFERYKGLEH